MNYYLNEKKIFFFFFFFKILINKDLYIKSRFRSIEKIRNNGYWIQNEMKKNKIKNTTSRLILMKKKKSNINFDKNNYSKYSVHNIYILLIQL